jgi:hypothetical protein
MDTGITIYGDEIYAGTEREPGEVTALGLDRVHVSMAGEARCNGDEEAGAEQRCKHCGQALNDDGDAVDGDADCIWQSADLEDGQAPHVPEYIPGSFANSASVSVGDDDSVTVTISVGDPRGAFAMQVHRNDAGELFLSVPDPSDGMPHMNLTAIRPGFMKIS